MPVAAGGNTQALEAIAGLYEAMEVAPPKLPVRLAIALPKLEAVAKLPRFPAAALPQGGRMASGRGLDAAACRASCLGEAAELVSCCEWGDEPVVRVSGDDLGPAALMPGDLLGLSDQQISERTAWNATMAEFDWRPAPYDPARVIDWMRVEDAITGAIRHAPADFMLIGRREAGDGEAVAIADSNGCASGATHEDARLAALLELVERDAAARWWYGRRGRPKAGPDRLSGPAALIRFLNERRRRTSLYDIATDIAVPAYAAVSAEADGTDIALGTAASPDGEAAMVSAVTEMLQMEVSLEIARHAPAMSKNWDAWRQEVTLATPPFNLGVPGAPDKIADPGPSSGWLGRVLESCVAAGVSVHFADLTRPILGVAVVRCLSIELCPYKPRFAKPRLLAADRGDTARQGDPARPNPQFLLV